MSDKVWATTLSVLLLVSIGFQKYFYENELIKINRRCKMSDGMNNMALRIQSEKRKQMMEEVKKYTIKDRYLDLRNMHTDAIKEIDILIQIETAKEG